VATWTCHICSSRSFQEDISATGTLQQLALDPQQMWQQENISELMRGPRLQSTLLMLLGSCSADSLHNVCRFIMSAAASFCGDSHILLLLLLDGNGHNAGCCRWNVHWGAAAEQQWHGDHLAQEATYLQVMNHSHSHSHVTVTPLSQQPPPSQQPKPQAPGPQPSICSTWCQAHPL